MSETIYEKDHLRITAEIRADGDLSIDVFREDMDHESMGEPVYAGTWYQDPDAGVTVPVEALPALLKLLVPTTPAPQRDYFAEMSEASKALVGSGMPDIDTAGVPPMDVDYMGCAPVTAPRVCTSCGDTYDVADHGLCLSCTLEQHPIGRGGLR